MAARSGPSEGGEARPGLLRPTLLRFQREKPGWIHAFQACAFAYRALKDHPQAAGNASSP